MLGLGCIGGNRYVKVVVCVVGGFNGVVAGDIIVVPTDQPTIQAGIDAAGSGDEVVVLPGIYNEYVNLGPNNITLRSTDPTDAVTVENTVIDGLGADTLFTSLVTFGAGNSTLDGFTIRNTLNSFLGGGVDMTGGGLVLNCIFQSHKNAAFIPGSSSFVNCKFVGNTIAVINNGDESSHPQFVNCVFLQNDSLAIDQPSVMWSNVSSPTLINCTVVENAGYAFESLNGSIITLSNTILWDNQDPEFVDGGGGLTPQLWYCNTDRGFVGVGTISSAPMFSLGFGLDPGSPCIDAGRNMPYPSNVFVDRGQMPRFVDDPDTVDTGLGDAPVIDIGAFEFQAEAVECAADLTGEGDLNFLDVSMFLSAFAAGDPVADFTGEGSFNFLDVSAFLNAFAVGCP